EHDFLKAIHTMETLYLKCTQAGSTYIKNVIDCLETLIDILEDVQPDNKIDAYWKKRQLNYWHHQLHVAKKSAGIRKETSFGRLNNIMNVEKTFGNFTGSIINERLKEFKTEFEQKSLVLEWVISQNKEMGMLLLSVGMIITFLLLGDWKYVWSDIQENGFLCLRTYMVKTAFCTGIPFGFLCLNRLGFFGVYSDSGDGGMLYTKLIDGYMLSAAYYFTVYILYKGVFFSGITSFADRFLRDLVGTVGGTLQGMVNSYDIGLFIGFVLLAHFYICGLDYIEYFWLRKLEKNRKCKDCL
ncbi:MAG: hypothetical protein Q4D76_20310, partial [Oscillospiraceae bacterium]|nr:hypothetical protein [Oscillospiraceae bacterium]